MISSWYVPLGGWFDEAVYSTPVKVSEGDTIVGNMTRTGATSFFIDTAVAGNATSHTHIAVDKPRLAAQPWAYVTLESYADYDDLNCTMWPTKPSVFRALADVGAPGGSPFNWTLVQKDAVCGAKAAVGSGGDVTLSF
jgi:hypothetical protein